jgi:aminopeptidase N
MTTHKLFLAKMKLAIYSTILLSICLFFLPPQAFGQLLQNIKKHSRADSLRGTLTPVRTSYDINYYHLDVKVDIDNRFISGSNLFRFTAVEDFKLLQFDLFENLKVERVVYESHELPFSREFNAVFIEFPTLIKKGSLDSFTVFYSGKPTVALKAPWDGGFVFSEDSNGKPWVATANQGIGASIWWPNKDHQADEVDSMMISVQVPKGLVDVSNGRLRKKIEQKDGYTRFDWFVSNPINNYNVSLNIGDYVNFTDTLHGENGILDLSFWALRENITKAKEYFPKNTKLMLKAFEYWLGPYPFYQDSYKLIDAPYAGMEHQSAITYGNGYKFGYNGRDGSGTGWGLKSDFIINHESGHEWFGNNITSKDLGDMWIHESFTNYSEALFIDYYFGKKAAQEYAHGNRQGIQNDRPIQGPYHVNQEGSGDMYLKGGVLLNMVRSIIDNDEKWRQILRGLNKTFYHQTVDYNDIVRYISKEAGIDFTSIFSQYLQHTNIPTLEFRFENGKALCRWIADVPNFNMPIKIRTKGGEYKMIRPTRGYTAIEIENLNKENLEVDTFNFYIGVLVE